MTEPQVRGTDRNEAATDLLLVLTQPGVIASTRVRDAVLRNFDAALDWERRRTVEPEAARDEGRREAVRELREFYDAQMTNPNARWCSAEEIYAGLEEVAGLNASESGQPPEAES